MGKRETTTAIRSQKREQPREKRTGIATDMYLPNHSGVENYFIAIPPITITGKRLSFNFSTENTWTDINTFSSGTIFEGNISSVGQAKFENATITIEALTSGNKILSLEDANVEQIYFVKTLGVGAMIFTQNAGGIAQADLGAYMLMAAGATTHTATSHSFNGNMGFFGSTAISQPTSTGETTGYTGGGGTALTHSDTFTGNSGTKAYTINDIVKHLKALGLLDTS